MLDLCQKPKEAQKADSVRNWEADIESVVVEECHEEEDPLGYRAVFYARGEAALKAAASGYVVGASLLKARLDNLRRAGFEAPMTSKAIRMVEKAMDVRLVTCCRG